jgi:CPA2 family monovalent cation:H+ antiporter-2
MTSELSTVLPEIAIAIGAAAIAAILFQALRLPLVLGYIVAGLVIGPNVTRAVADPRLISTLSDLGVILLFFTIGLEFSVRTVARVGLPTLITVLLELTAVILVMFGVGQLLGWTATESVFVAMGVAIASTMLVVKGLEELKLKGLGVELILAMMVVEDLLSILLLAILTAVASGAGVSAGELGVLLAKLGGFLILMVAAGLLVIPRLIRALARSPRTEPLMITSIAVCFLMVWLAEHAGYSIALGAFVAGMLIAESGKGHEVDALVRPFRDAFAAIFFIAIGMMIAPSEIAEHWPSAILVAIMLVVGKSIGVTIANVVTGNGLRRGVQAGLALSQIGELAFIAVALGVTAGVVRPFLLPVVVGASCVTAMSGSFQMRAGPQAGSWLEAKLPRRLVTFIASHETRLAKLRRPRQPDQ